MRFSPEAAALLFINRYFPECAAAFLAGSTVRGDHTSASDLDIVIIGAEEPVDRRRCFIKYEWPIEVFLYSKDSFQVFFDSDCMLGIPYLPRMCAEGIILKDMDGTARKIKVEAKQRLAEGPPPWTQSQTDNARYLITELLDDLEGSEDVAENLFTAGQLADILHEFILRTNRQWTGFGKWTIRSLRRFDEKTAAEFTEAFQHFYQSGKKEKLTSFTESIIEPWGGKLFEGYKS
ncbi:nucleotidyltransferase domain-containing protein [Bacillus marinisedimentorum]|uniref:nucleotidyltransferase domain-containing protein n=1 Tax=Bacillus marinisedimentorum TaxID=1821260 RepID=UPI000872194C|nr:nucleotidyltransferase domain-containing protein [Bacillus marinisedimentorum]